MQTYIVKQGDTIQSIALRHKLNWETVWQHGSNADLRKKRPEPNLLFPGDIVQLPERDIKQVACATDQRHRFSLQGTHTLLRLRLLDEEDQPLANMAYQLDIDGNTLEGQTDGDGNLERSIPALTCKVLLKIPSKEMVFEVRVGSLDPSEEVQGLQSRLYNLGYYHGRSNNQLDPKTAMAVRKFQKENGLEVNGNADAATLKKLEEIHAY